jgi:hypothetical protein
MYSNYPSHHQFDAMNVLGDETAATVNSANDWNSSGGQARVRQRSSKRHRFGNQNAHYRRRHKPHIVASFLPSGGDAEFGNDWYEDEDNER